MTTVAATSLMIISFVAGVGFSFLFVSVSLQIFKLPQPVPRDKKLQNTMGF